MVPIAPYLVFLDRLTARVESGRFFREDSALQRAYEEIAAELAKTNEEAHRADVWVGTAEVATSHAIAPATLNRWCREYGVGRWARQDGRDWMVHFPSFRAWLATDRPSRRAA